MSSLESPIESLKQKLANNISTSTIVADISRPSVVANLRQADLDELVRLLEGKQGLKIHGKVMVTLYAIVVMKGHQTYNTKNAIQSLTKYYRSLMPAHHTQQPSDPKLQPHHPDPNNKTRAVIANLLIRIPSFSNYKLILRDLHPDLLPVSAVLQHRQRIYKQCPNIYKDHLIAKHKHAWHRLMTDDAGNYPLHSDFATLGKYLQTIAQCTTPISVTEVYLAAERECEFIRNRIGNICKQEINIEDLFKEVVEVLLYGVRATQEQRLVYPELVAQQEKSIRAIKAWTLGLLRLLVVRLRHKLCRKFSVLHELIDSFFNRTYDGLSIEPAGMFSFLATLLQVYGLGFYNFDQVVSNDNISCIAKLVSALCLNDYSRNNKQSQQTINFQAKSNKNPNSKKQQIHINIYDNTVVETAYEYYLKTTTEYQREHLLAKVLDFLEHYYLAKRNVAKEFYFSAEILGMLASSKNKFSHANLQKIRQIKQEVIFKGFEQVGHSIELFCDQTFRQYVKKRKEPRLEIHAVQQIVIQPTLADSFVSFTNQKPRSVITQQKQQKIPLKKTNSMDVHMEGWNSSEAKQTKNEDKPEASEMFYSIKQCSVIEEKDPQEAHPEGEEFILTPEF